ncbi:MAG TPA: hypothetical protein VKA60_16115 [Blastocatellia bacterium]|nr:hypothetical protein [Blastocatellia bacterium]
MKSYRQWMVVSMLLALTATGAVVSAQDKQSDKAAKAQQKAERNVIVQRGGDYMFDTQDGAPPARVWFGDPGTSFFVSSELLNRESAVKGQPYSAQAVTESIQTLADGNRIVRRTTANLYRDGEGRTRHDQTVGDMAPYATAVGEPSQVTMIYDPVAGAHYMLDARSKTARKMTFITLKDKVDGKDVVTVQTAPVIVGSEQAAEGAVRTHVEVHAAGEPVPLEAKKWALAAGGANTFNLKVREPKIEQLGKQTIEGVEAEGRRATITIPAGEIGNEQPINIIDETWYSPELKVTVMTRHSDPRMGETVYKLTNINRAEPARSLFEVPSEYTIKETVEPKMKMLLEREMQRSRKPADKQEN